MKPFHLILALAASFPARTLATPPVDEPAARPSGWSLSEAEAIRSGESGPEPLGHKHLVDEQRALPPESFGGVDPRIVGTQRHLFNVSTGPRVTREVLGYLPYWSYTATTPYVPMRWDLLTILAWFSIEMDGTGAITNRRGWGGQTTARIVQDAHAHGVKVIITITNFNNTEIGTLVNSAANRRRAIDNCLMLMAEHQADGINIDFEFVPRSGREGFVTFMTELKDAVRAAAPNGHEGHVSLAGPAVDWGGAYDYDALLENTDGIMVMAYGYHWSGSNPGPNSPLRTGTLWSGRSVSWTIDDYLTYGGVENRGGVIIGLPWYGRDWEVANTNVPGVKVGNGGSRTFRVAEPEALRIGKNWEDISKSVYYHRTASEKLYQVWYDDGRAFEEKLAYIDAMDLGGVGIWALGYEGSLPDFWNAIDKVLGLPAVEPGPEPVAEVGPELVESELVEAEGAEVGPEPQPEPAVEKPEQAEPPEGTDTTLAADTSGSSSDPRVLSPSRSVSFHTVNPTSSGGCGAAAGSSWALGAVLLAGLAAARRRRRLGR